MEKEKADIDKDKAEDGGGQLGRAAWRQFWRSDGLAATLGGFAMLMSWTWLWCAQTTFRGMSFPDVYVNSMLFAMVLALPSILKGPRWTQLLLWLVAAGVLEANLMYCRTYISWIPAASYLLASNLSDFTASIHDSLRWPDAIPALIAIGTYVFMRRRKAVSPTPLAPTCAVATVLVVASAVLSLCRGGMSQHIETLRGSCYYSTTPPVIYTIPGTLLASSLGEDEKLTPEAEAATEQWLREHAEIDHSYPLADRPDRKNLVIIFCESLESWLIDAKADGDKTITPYLNSLVADSTTLFFPHVLSQVGTGRSIDAQLLMLAGLLPLNDAVWSMRYPDHAYPSIAQAMHRRNPQARTMLLTSDKPITWNQTLVAKAFEIDTMLSRDHWEMTELVGNPAKLSDGAFMLQAVDKLKSGLWPEGEPAYLHMVTYSGHNPFKLQDKLKGIEITGDYPDRMRDYMTMANYTDRSLRPMIEYLRSRSDWDSTMVVIVGDHEALGVNRGEWLPLPEPSKILASEAEVPLIILNAPVTGRNDTQISQVDVYSAIVDLMGLRPYAWLGLGLSPLSPAYEGPQSTNPHMLEESKISSNIIKFDLFNSPALNDYNPSR